MSRKSNDVMQLTKQLVMKLRQDHPDATPTEIGKMLYDQYGKKISNSTLFPMCAEPLTPSESESNVAQYENEPEMIGVNEIIAILKRRLDDAIKENDDALILKYSARLLEERKGKVDLANKFRTRDLLVSEQNKKIINVSFGNPELFDPDFIEWKKSKTKQKDVTDNV